MSFDTLTNKVMAHPDKDATVIVHTERFDGLLDNNAELRATQQYGSKDMRHVAEIPGIMIEDYCFRTGMSWAEFFAEQKHMKALLNDPAMAYFRIAPGRV